MAKPSVGMVWKVKLPEDICAKSDASVSRLTPSVSSDELTAFCPITRQPDFYTATIVFEPESLCLESKSLKLYLAHFHDQGVFCEELAVTIRDDVAAALRLGRERVHVTLRQKARGGITITASV